ncbi:hypothetical protein QL992_13555 [Microbacterium sp. APC 3898]|uniref:Uncharacterized protein n=1 Tax=Planococcus notacanthi TaxID=3035188 RepID=A0ABT7ZHW3_9BACL|nr:MULTISPECIES: hypothetical protein [Terrabacteria group]MDN3426728.1 hypothetical protein [Planococcus sp. APC 4016]MDN3500238.1 hypothetical protein [Microbacterium sp. APC 3898]
MKMVLKNNAPHEKRNGKMINFSAIVNTTAFPQWEEILATALNLADEFGVVSLAAHTILKTLFLTANKKSLPCPT